MNILPEIKNQAYYESVAETASTFLPQINDKITQCFKEQIEASFDFHRPINPDVEDTLTRLLNVLHSDWRVKFSLSDNGETILIITKVSVPGARIVAQAPGGPAVDNDIEEKESPELQQANHASRFQLEGPLKLSESSIKQMMAIEEEEAIGRAEREFQLNFIKNNLLYFSAAGISKYDKETIARFVKEWIENATQEDFEKFVIGITGRAPSDNPNINISLIYGLQEGIEFKMIDCLMRVYLKHQINVVYRLDQKKFNNHLKREIDCYN